MNTDILFTEEQAESISGKVLLSLSEKIKTQLVDSFYNEMQSFLYDHYENATADIKKRLINDLVDEYIKDPANYKYQKIRNRLWLEHKDEIIKSLTDDGIKADVEKTLLQYTGNNYHFNWQWKDGIVKIILNNWDQFKDDERIASAFGRTIEHLKSRIANLESKLLAIENEIDS